MPPYLRFPENETIQQKIWGLRPRNPTCGKISLETGAKTFAWVNIVITGLCVVAFSFLLITVLYTLLTHSSHQEILHNIAQSKANGQLSEDLIEKIHVKQSFPFMFVMLSLLLASCAALLSLYWKLRKAIVERDVPRLKKLFLIVLVVEIAFMLLWDTETEIISAKFIFVDVPCTVFEVIGLIFTYSFIVSLINPDYGQEEDLNRIQFNP